MRRSTQAADTRAAQAALARHSLPEIVVERVILVDDTTEDVTLVLTVVCERTRLPPQEEQS
jgi:hypothetical protein